MSWTNQNASSSASGGGAIKFSQGAVLTPSAGSITPTDPFHHVAAGAISTIATTNVDTSVPNLLILKADGAITITTGASLVARNTTLATNDVIVFVLDGTVWTEIEAPASITNATTITVKDANFIIQDDGDTTKKGQFQLSGVTAGNTRTLTWPDFNGTIATLAGTETLSGKTLTAPIVAVLKPASDSTTAIKLTKSDGATAVLTVDTTNANVGVGAATASARLHVGAGGTGTTPEEIRIDSGSGTGGSPYISFYRNSIAKSLVGIAGAAGTGIIGVAANDMFVRNTQAINFSANGGSTNMMTITALNSVVLNATGSALATNATDGFSYLPSCAGTPTGVPTAFTGTVAFAYDSTNNIIYIYNGAWKKTAALT